MNTEMITWFDCAESLPDDDTTVLVALPSGETWVGWHQDRRWPDASTAGEIEVTHWADMPRGPGR